MLFKKRKITDITNFRRIKNKTPRCTECRLYEEQCWSIKMSIYCDDEINKNLHYPIYAYVV